MKKHHIHLLSDSTGGTLNSVVKACLAQFEGAEVEQHFWPLVRSQSQLLQALEGISKKPGLVLYTMVDEGLAKGVDKHCQMMNLPSLSILAPVLQLMSHYFGMTSTSQPGLQHRLNEEYFARMDAVDYALHHDDGQKSDSEMAKADVILVGVSRTSKTPTCVYLANRGVKAANVPYVPGIPFPERVLGLTEPLFVALTASPDRLIDIRRNRLKQLGEVRDTDYLDELRVQEEVKEARRFYSRNGWPVIDVTRRSVEETAAEILSLLDAHRNRKQNEV
ncbi:MAG: kinase/pyrophosphorylase [Micavibrio sp.]|nr:kinase/pyrophosphorylase [Micavibrio sp.]